MIPLFRKSLSVGAILTLLATPAMAQPYNNGGHYGAPSHRAPFHEPYHGGWQHERHEAMWRAYQPHRAWSHADHFHGDDHGFGGNGDRGGF